MNLGDRPDLINSLDPRIKVLFLIVVSCMILLFNDPPYQLGVLCWVTVIALLAHSMIHVYRARYVLLLSFLVPFLSWQVFGPVGNSHGINGAISFRMEHVMLGLSAGIRYITMLTAGLTFLTIAPVEDVMSAMTKLRVPRPLSFAVSLALRLIPLYVEDIEAIRQAHRARGFEFRKTDPFGFVRGISSLLVPFFLQTIRHSTQLSMSLETRGFTLDEERTELTERQLRRADYFFAAANLVALVCCVGVRLLGHGLFLRNP